MTTAPQPVEVLTFGCRLNIVESEEIHRVASSAGHDDIVVVNSCAVTAEASRQARQAIRRARRERPDSTIVVTGCAAEVDRDGFAAMPEVDRRVPNAVKTLPSAWAWREGSSRQVVADAPRPHTRGFVEIQNGCDHRCTFCIIPIGRGASRSTAPDEVIATVRRRVETGIRDVVLTGVDITSYEAGNLRLGGLVRRLLAAVPDLARLRLSSLDCIEADAELFDAIATEARFMPHLHLSLQSGSDLILKRMKRRHGRDDAIAFCDRVRALRPDMVFGADVIVGFPTEAEADFDQTRDLVEACAITHLHVFPYSPRPGTPAARMPQVGGEVVKARAAVLRRHGEDALRRHLDRQVGRRLSVLTERGGRGRTEDFTAVALPGGSPNLLVDVTITGQDGRMLQAEA